MTLLPAAISFPTKIANTHIFKITWDRMLVRIISAHYACCRATYKAEVYGGHLATATVLHLELRGTSPHRAELGCSKTRHALCRLDPTDCSRCLLPLHHKKLHAFRKRVPHSRGIDTQLGLQRYCGGTECCRPHFQLDGDDYYTAQRGIFRLHKNEERHRSAHHDCSKSLAALIQNAHQSQFNLLHLTTM